MPRRPVDKSQLSPNSKERVRFTFEPDRNSPNGILLTWILHKARDGKEKMMSAGRSFWLPFAYQASGKYSKAEVRAVANEAIWRLEEQIRFLRENFEIEAPNRTPATPVSQSTEPEPEPEQPQFFADMDLTIEDDMLGSLDDAMG
jgi:hypothetical protein